MDNNRNRLLIVGAGAFLIGWAVGLFIFGWWLTYLIALADLYAFDGNSERVKEALGNWPEADQAICQLASESTDPAESTRLISLAAVLNGEGCTPAVMEEGATETEEGGGLTNFIIICGLLALLGIIGLAIYLIWQRQSKPPEERPVEYQEPPVDTQVPATAPAEQQVTPIARFQTTYARGHDTYDDSFSIENATGDFLGECGVGVSETIGADTPKNVTAFEVWLFDKNDIRTVTKVIMSDHAFFDDAIKAKLAPKGEPVLARPNETVVLETASLIVNAVITEMEYGSASGLPQSFFERLTIELSAWAKDGDFGQQDAQGGADDMLEF
jgi:hypothetical protein